MNQDTAAAVAAPAATTLTLAALPPLDQALDAGIFAGLTTKPDGTHHAVVLLPEAPAKRMAWRNAMDWAAGLQAELPTRPVAALLFANARATFEPAWYWTSEEHSDDGSLAWTQGFGYGSQFSVHKSYEGRARAVRLIPLGT